MNQVLRPNGLSARREIIQRIAGIFRQRNHLAKGSRLWAILVATSLIISSCHERSSGQDARPGNKNPVSANDTLHKPKVNIKVNRHYDEKGNMIGFDSTYSSYYSNIEGDTGRMDSLMTSFDRFYNRDHHSFFRNEFDRLFFNDSLRYPDFFHDDFFLKRYELNDLYFRDMMHRMDSIKNNFYDQQSKKQKK
jgi:hypothetical protein